MLLIIILFFSAETDQHDNVRQSVVCKRRGFNSVVRYASTVYDWLTFWTLCPHKSQGLITVSLHAYLVEIAMLRLAVRLERYNSIDFIFLKKSLVRVSGDLHSRDHVLLSLSVEVKSSSILHNYKIGYLLVKTLLSSVDINNFTRNST